MRTCEELRKLNFHSIRMVEVRLRPMEARHVTVENAYVGRSSTSTTFDSVTTALTSSSSAQPNGAALSTVDPEAAYTNGNTVTTVPTVEATGGDMLIEEDGPTYDTTANHNSSSEPTTPIPTGVDTADSSSSSATANVNSNNNSNSGRKAKAGAKPHFKPEVMPPTQEKYARYSNTMQGHTVSNNNSILLLYSRLYSEL